MLFKYLFKFNFKLYVLKNIDFNKLFVIELNLKRVYIIWQNMTTVV